MNMARANPGTFGPRTDTVQYPGGNATETVHGSAIGGTVVENDSKQSFTEVAD